MTDAALDPLQGSMKDRLCRHLSHNPELSGDKRNKCQLHRWTRGRDGTEVRGRNIMKCSTCKVHLCAPCWKLFHECEDLVGQKSRIARD